MVDVSAHTADIPLSPTWGSLCHSHKAEGLVFDRAMSNKTHSLRMSLISYTYGLFFVIFFLLILQTTKDNDH